MAYNLPLRNAKVHHVVINNNKREDCEQNKGKYDSNGIVGNTYLLTC